MDLFVLLGDPRRGLAILSGLVGVAAALFVWLNAEPGPAAACTVLCLIAAAAAFPAVRAPLKPGLVWLLVSILALAAGIYVGFVAAA